RVLHANANDQAADDNGAVSVAVPDGVVAVFLLHVVPPQLVPGEVERDQLAGAVVDHDDRPIGHGRRAGEVLEPVEPLVLAFAAIARADPFARRRTGADLARPGDFAGGRVDADGEQLVAVLAGGENHVAPDGRRARPVRQGALPDDVLLLAPVQRDVGFRADAVTGRPAPLRPVAGQDERAGGE